ncbi:hypothetical protein XENORESO_004437, partial [Xenotaenia resolanae]
EIPFHLVPVKCGTQQITEAVPGPNFNTVSSAFIEKLQNQTCMYNESGQMIQQTSPKIVDTNDTYRFSTELYNQSNETDTFSRKTQNIQQTISLFEDMALPDAILNDYFSQKSVFAVPAGDSLLEYDYEGEGDSTGSVGSCYLLEPDNDLNFLTDLGPKFRTLADICSPLTLTSKTLVTPKASGSVKTTTNIIEPVFKPQFDNAFQTKHVDVEAEKVVSSADVIQSSVSTVTKESTTTTLPHSSTTSIRHSAKLSYPPQTVVLQQPPVYYTTSPALQPMHYIVQPDVQNKFVLGDGTHGNNFPGFYVINDPKSLPGLGFGSTQSSLSGLVIQDTEGPKSPASPTGSLRATVLLPSQAVSQAYVGSSTSWGQNLGINYVLLKDKVQELDPGSPQGILPRDAILVQKAATPQGVLGLAAQDNVCIYFLVKKANGDGVVVLKLYSGQISFPQKGEIGFGSFNVLKSLTKQPKMRMGCMEAVTPKGRQTKIWLCKERINKLIINKLHRSFQLNQAIQTFCILSYRQELSVDVQTYSTSFDGNSDSKRKTSNMIEEIVKMKLPEKEDLQETIIVKIAGNTCIKAFQSQESELSLFKMPSKSIHIDLAFFSFSSITSCNLNISMMRFCVMELHKSEPIIVVTV